MKSFIKDVFARLTALLIAELLRRLIKILVDD